MTSYVEIKNLLVTSHIGCNPGEQEIAQNLSISIKAYFDASKSYQSDQLEDTVNYVMIADVASMVAKENPRFLLEKLGFEIAKSLFETSKITQKIELEIRKFSTAKNCDYVAFGATFQK